MTDNRSLVPPGSRLIPSPCDRALTKSVNSGSALGLIQWRRGPDGPRGAALVEITGQGSGPRASSSACALGPRASASWSRCATHLAQRDVEVDPAAGRGRRGVRDGGGGRRRLIGWGFRGGVRTTGARDARRAQMRASATAHLHAVACLRPTLASLQTQLTLSSSRARARMFCYGIFTHPLSSAYERPAYRISLCVLACVGCGTRGRLLGLSGRICHKVSYWRSTGQMREW